MECGCDSLHSPGGLVHEGLKQNDSQNIKYSVSKHLIIIIIYFSQLTIVMYESLQQLRCLNFGEMAVRSPLFTCLHSIHASNNSKKNKNCNGMSNKHIYNSNP